MGWDLLKSIFWVFYPRKVVSLRIFPGRRGGNQKRQPSFGTQTTRCREGFREREDPSEGLPLPFRINDGTKEGLISEPISSLVQRQWLFQFGQINNFDTLSLCRQLVCLGTVYLRRTLTSKKLTPTALVIIIPRLSTRTFQGYKLALSRLAAEPKLKTNA